MQAPLISPAEVRDILSEPKETVKAVAWTARVAAGKAQWMEFASPCRLRGEARDDIIFRAAYRPAGTSVHGLAVIALPETCSASLFVGPHRVLGLDCGDTFHTSLVGNGRAHHGRTLQGRIHQHVWHDDGEGYAEPVDAPLHDLPAVISYFLQQANLVLAGGFAHPLKGRQIELLV